MILWLACKEMLNIPVLYCMMFIVRMGNAYSHHFLPVLLFTQTRTLPSLCVSVCLSVCLYVCVSLALSLSLSVSLSLSLSLSFFLSLSLSHTHTLMIVSKIIVSFFLYFSIFILLTITTCIKYFCCSPHPFSPHPLNFLCTALVRT